MEDLVSHLPEYLHAVETGRYHELPHLVEAHLKIPNLLILLHPHHPPFLQTWASGSFPEIPELPPTPGPLLMQRFRPPEYTLFPLKHRDILLGWWVLKGAPPSRLSTLLYAVASAWHLHVDELLSQKTSRLSRTLQGFLSRAREEDLAYEDLLRDFLQEFEELFHNVRGYYLRQVGTFSIEIHSVDRSWIELFQEPMDLPAFPLLVRSQEFHPQFPPALQNLLTPEGPHGWYVLPTLTTPHREALVVAFPHTPHPLSLDALHRIQRDLTWTRMAFRELERSFLHDLHMRRMVLLARSLREIGNVQTFLDHLLDLFSQACGTTTAAAALLTEDGRAIRIVAGRGMWRDLTGQTFTPYEGLMGHALNERRIVMSENYAQDSRLGGSPYVRNLRYGLAIPLILPSGKPLGVLVFGSRDRMPCMEDQEFLSVLTEVAMNFYDRIQKDRELLYTYRDILNLLMKTLAVREHGTHEHTARVTALALALGKKLGLSEEELLTLYWGAMLHDIGKIGIPDSILKKAGPLSEEEWVIMRQHPLMGREILKDLHFLRDALAVVVYHHERYDGKGYPQGLKGEAIPRLARIFSVVDAFDAMISDRPYRKGMSVEEALREIARNRGTQFDPDIADAFIQLVQERPDLVNNPRSAFEELSPVFRLYQLFFLR